MYRKVLVPLDGSRESEEVLTQLQGELAPDGEVTLLKVISPMSSRSVGGGNIILGSQLEENERSEASDYLRDVARRERGDSVRWGYQVVVARSVPQCIVDFAMHHEPDLIAMYTHERKGLARLFKGSVAAEVQRNAPTLVRVFTPSDMTATEPVEATAEAGIQVEGNPRQTVHILKGADVFSGLSDVQIGELVPLVQRIRIPEGQLLGMEGELSDQFFIIAEGEAQLGAHTEVGDIAARVAISGQSFPLAILVGSGNLITSARALTDMEVLQLDKSQLVGLCSQNPELGLRVYMNLAELLAGRYGDTLRHLTHSIERELRDNDMAANEQV